MAGHTQIELDEVHTPSSDYNFAQPTLPSTSGMLSSFPHIGPMDLAGSSWDLTAEGPQNFPEFADATDYYAGGAEGLYPGMTGFSEGHYYPNDLGTFASHVNPQIFDASLVGYSPQSWGSLSPVSRMSSPAADGRSEDVWAAGPSRTSPEDSPSNSPALVGQSPRMTTKFDGPQYATEDIHDMPAFSLPPAFGARRFSGEGESARDHFLYKNAYPQADGLFHCPWEGEETCNHKPEKLKCNYDKFVDSHLKPYRCKVEGCQNARFSSTACLLRHEREAHGMHGQGEKPYLCTYEGCSRSQPGNGFPRQWNLRDHLRRVHNDTARSGRLTTPSNPYLGSGDALRAGEV